MPKPHFLLIILVHFLLSTTPTTPLTHPGDITTLKSLKSLINPSSIPPASCLSSWDFTSDPCTSPKTTHFICGLTCSQDSTRIVSITLDSVSYSGTLTPLVSQLTQLVLLDLGQNSFHGLIPNSLSSLSLLQTLSLRYNSFTGPIPNSVTTLSNLVDLDLSGNYLSGPIPKLSSLAKLTRLDLSLNKLTGEIPILPPNLLQLAIKSNSLSGPITKNPFTESTQLETIDLSSNSFTGVLPNWVFQLPSLQQINLSNNTLTGLEISKPERRSFNNLIAVDLGYNKIEGNVPVNFTDYPYLASLSLRYNRLRGPIPLEYSKKGKLRRLYLDGNYLSGIPPPGFFSDGGGGGEATVTGSFGDNCLRKCPRSSGLCLPSQKPMSVCKQVYGGKSSTFY